MTSFVAVDSGGTKVQAVNVPNIQTPWSRSELPAFRHFIEQRPGNLNELGGDSGLRQLAEDLKAGLQVEDPANTDIVMGMAGVTTARDVERVTRVFAEAGFTGNVLPVNDSDLIIHAIGGRGVSLIGGTGQNSRGYGIDGSVSKVGGWGHLLGDQGSGFYMGRSAINDAIFIADKRWQYSVLRAHIGTESEKEVFVNAVLQYFAIPEGGSQSSRLEAIIPLIYDHKDDAPKKIAGLSRVVFALAKNGNAIAQNLVTETVADITQIIAAMFDHLAVKTETVVLVGGLYTNGDAEQMLLRPVREKLGSYGFIPEFRIFKDEPPELLLEAARFSALKAGTA